ncbi:unnamed protein product [Wickerhamomyces anomalus]
MKMRRKTRLKGKDQKNLQIQQGMQIFNKTGLQTTMVQDHRQLLKLVKYLESLKQIQNQHQQKLKNVPKKAKTNHKSPQKDKDSTIDFNKPTKPRLPNQRTTMNEMRKRVAAILEFIGRTQVDIATEQDDKSELTKYVEDDVHKEKIEKLFENYNGSLELMDGLTRKLLIWEEKYGKLGEK